MKETMEMIQILEQNKKEAQLRAKRQALIAKQKKEQKKEQIKTGILLALLIISFILSVALLKKIMDRDYNNCIESGKSESVCSQMRSIDK
jgi:cytoskeletal protein RodZ